MARTDGDTASRKGEPESLAVSAGAQEKLSRILAAARNMLQGGPRFTRDYRIVVSDKKGREARFNTMKSSPGTTWSTCRAKVKRKATVHVVTGEDWHLAVFYLIVYERLRGGFGFHDPKMEVLEGGSRVRSRGLSFQLVRKTPKDRRLPPW